MTFYSLSCRKKTVFYELHINQAALEKKTVQDNVGKL